MDSSNKEISSFKLEPCLPIAGLTPRQSREQSRSRLAVVDPSATPSPTADLALQLRDEVAQICSDAKHRSALLSYLQRCKTDFEKNYKNTRAQSAPSFSGIRTQG